MAPIPPSPLRRSLDRLYEISGIAAALCLAATCVVMLAQVLTREAGFLFRGADDIVAWLCAASAFLALGHTFRKGELVRMALVIDNLPARARWLAELIALIITTLLVAYMVWSVSRFVLESYQFKEVAQGLLRVPIWIPQLSFLVGVVIFFIAVADELARVIARKTPAYQIAEEERRARGDFSETV